MSWWDYIQNEDDNNGIDTQLGTQNKIRFALVWAEMNRHRRPVFFFNVFWKDKAQNNET